MSCQCTASLYRDGFCLSCGSRAGYGAVRMSTAASVFVIEERALHSLSDLRRLLDGPRIGERRQPSPKERAQARRCRREQRRARRINRR